MASLLLETKLFAPRPQRGFVARPRLAERLRRGAESAVTLVSAPAGFGKTTLLAELVAAASQPIAWVSVDRDDDDPARFWAHVAAAIDRAQPGVGARALARTTPSRWRSPDCSSSSGDPPGPARPRSRRRS